MAKKIDKTHDPATMKDDISCRRMYCAINRFVRSSSRKTNGRHEMPGFPRTKIGPAGLIISIGKRAIQGMTRDYRKTLSGRHGIARDHRKTQIRRQGITRDLGKRAPPIRPIRPIVRGMASAVESGCCASNRGRPLPLHGGGLRSPDRKSAGWNKKPNRKYPCGGN